MRGMELLEEWVYVANEPRAAGDMLTRTVRRVGPICGLGGSLNVGAQERSHRTYEFIPRFDEREVAHSVKDH